MMLEYALRYHAIKQILLRHTNKKLDYQNNNYSNNIACISMGVHEDETHPFVTS